MDFDRQFTIDSPSGAALAVRMAHARPKPRGVFLLSHGLAEHSRRYGRLAGYLSQRGYATYAFDHRGHGETRAPDAPQGRFAWRGGESRLVEDLAAVRLSIEAEHPGLPILLFGHSMGGIIAARAAQTEPRAHAGLCIWNSHLDPGLAGKLGVWLLKAERFFKGSDVPSRYGPLFTFDAWAKSIESAATPFDWLSHDPAEVAAYMADPLCGFDCSVSLWIDLIGMAHRAGLRHNLERLPRSLPISLVGGGEDPATDRGAAMRWLAGRLRTSGFTNVHLTIYPEMRHETLHETGREQAMKMLGDWADMVCSDTVAESSMR